MEIEKAEVTFMTANELRKLADALDDFPLYQGGVYYNGEKGRVCVITDNTVALVSNFARPSSQ